MGLWNEEEETASLKACKIPTNLETPKKCLVGKLFSDIPHSHATITAALYNMWNKPKGFICEQVKDRIYRFYFENEFDASTKLHRQPWNYNGNLLVLRPWKKGHDISAYNFDHVPFSVQVRGLPLKYRTSTICQKLCSRIGSVLEAEIYVTRDSQSSIPKAVVLIDLSKPLQFGAYLDTDDYGNVWVDFKYEKLPIFCYYCGKIGHEQQGCSDLIKDRNENNVRSSKYGPELKADDQIGKMIIIDGSVHGLKVNNNTYNDEMVSKVAQQLSSLHVTDKHKGIIDEQDLNPTMLTMDNIELGMLKFNPGSNHVPHIKNKNKAHVSGYKARVNSSVSSSIPGSNLNLILGDVDEYQAMKRRSDEEIDDGKKGKRVCFDLS
ncbi:hypothetical protein RIF29_29914 [Crotalaria pallida]|uniref:CCHC-type domain-containing protein n=1 Tax=Crotalaria pallida TaxID=3830 RepID=A0AAN9HUB1_CROPI